MPLAIFPFVTLNPSVPWTVEVGLCAVLEDTYYREFAGAEATWPSFGELIEMLEELLDKRAMEQPERDFLCGFMGTLGCTYNRFLASWTVSIGTPEGFLAGVYSTETMRDWVGSMRMLKDRCDRDGWPESVVEQPMEDAPIEWLRARRAKYEE